MNRLPKLSFLAALAVLVAWSLAVAGADEQKKMLEERVATVTVQVDQHEIRVKVDKDLEQLFAEESDIF